MSVITLGALNKINKNTFELFSSGQQLNQSVQVVSNIVDLKEGMATMYIRLSSVATVDTDIEIVPRILDPSGNVVGLSDTVVMRIPSGDVYGVLKIRLNSRRVSFRFENISNADVTVLYSAITSTSFDSEVEALNSKVVDQSTTELSLVSGSWNLAPEAENATEIYELSTNHVSIGFAFDSFSNPFEIEVTPRYHSSEVSSSYVKIGEPVRFTIESIFDTCLLDLEFGTKVSFRIVNKSLSTKNVVRASISKAISKYNDLAIDKIVSDYSLAIGQNAFGPFESKRTDKYLHIHFQDVPGGFDVLTRYYDSASGAIKTFETIHEEASPSTNRFIIPLNLKSLIWGIRIDASSTDLIQDMFISDVSTLKEPISSRSSDGNLIVQHTEKNAPGYDAFYGSFKSIRTFKPDFHNSIFPETIKDDSLLEESIINLQNGVYQLRVYLQISNIIGNPFSVSGVTLKVSLGDGGVYPIYISSNEMSQEGTVVIILGDGSDLTDFNVENNSVVKVGRLLHGKLIKVSMNVPSGVDASNYFTFKLDSYQKFK